ncbi:MAG: tripartite tricarboxylate transporter TctB family protein [Spirochaetales bacterium]|nr:tripartite tricarboxylate transporter TctB family protein [Spirochaetales bacterium]
MKKYPILEPIFIILVGIFVIIMSYQIEIVVTSIAIGPDFMPRLIGVFFVLLGLGLVPEALKKQKSIKAEPAATEVEKAEKLSRKEWMIKHMHFIIWVWAFIYALLMEELGFLFDSIIFMFGSMFLLTMREKKRNWPVIIILSLVIPTFVYILFRQKFFLMLPMGLCKYIPLRILR